MNNVKKVILAITGLSLVAFAMKEQKIDPVIELQYCSKQVEKALPDLLNYNKMPRNIQCDQKKWNCTSYNDWTGGFWPGILWYDYEFTRSETVKAKADSFTMAMMPVTMNKAIDHDMGFMIYCSMGNGYRLTGNPVYKQAILRAADSLGALFNPKVGTILSWPAMVKRMNWPHNTIIDNMINLELLFWASKNGGSHHLYEIAEKHALTTMQNHFRPDYSCYHVVVYDTITGRKIKGVTHQGYADNSMWARGQAWAIYGFAMVARETKEQRFLDFAQKVSEPFIKRLPDDFVPYWDFDAPGIPNEPRDVSAAAIAASGFLELSVLIKDIKTSAYYRTMAEKILQSISSKKYQSRDKNVAFLLHSTGHKPNHSEIDVPIIYADYYYIEALLRLKKINEGHGIY
jgi:unsaturated chondroitin disaccharide hydrolase